MRIEAHDRAGLERLLRYCARPTFSMEQLRKAGKDLVYRCAKQHSEPASDRHTDQRGVKADELTLTPLELINHIAALVPPPRTHRHCYFGVLTPNSPLRAQVTAMGAAPPLVIVQPTQSAVDQGAVGVATPVNAVLISTEPGPPKRSQAHYLLAVLIARI